MLKETWKICNENENYLISNNGKVKNRKTNKILKQSTTIWGYKQVHLSKNNKAKAFSVHRLVALNFIPNSNNKPCVNHINGIKTDNRVENLEWCTISENSKHLYNILKYKNHNKGKKYSQEIKNKMSISKYKKIKCIELKKVYSSQIEAQNQTGINQGNISACCRGQRKTAGGYHWIFE